MAEEIGIEVVDERLIYSVIIVRNMAILLQNTERMELKKIRLIMLRKNKENQLCF